MVGLSNDYKSYGSGECDVFGKLVWFKDGECYYFNGSIIYLS